MDFDIKQYERYFTYDIPIPYISIENLEKLKIIKEELDKYKDLANISDNQKQYIERLVTEYSDDNKILYIYPVTMKEYIDFFVSVNCLNIDKNKIPDPKIIKMSYLDFIFHLINQNTEDNTHLQMFINIMSLCLKIEANDIRYLKDEQGKYKLILKDNIYDKNDFDNIRKIICYQNIPDYDDAYIDPKVEEALKEAEEFVSKHSKKTCSLEDQMICVMLALHETDMDKIHNLTIRKFSKILKRYDYKLHYEIYKQAEATGMVTFKQEIDHWMSDLTKGKYSDLVVEYDGFKNKINQQNAV